MGHHRAYFSVDSAKFWEELLFIVFLGILKIDDQNDFAQNF